MASATLISPFRKRSTTDSVLGTLDRHVAVNDVLQDLRWIALKWVSKTTASSRGTLKAVAWNHRNA